MINLHFLKFWENEIDFVSYCCFKVTFWDVSNDKVFRCIRNTNFVIKFYFDLLVLFYKSSYLLYRRLVSS